MCMHTPMHACMFSTLPQGFFGCVVHRHHGPRLQAQTYAEYGSRTAVLPSSTPAAVTSTPVFDSSSTSVVKALAESGGVVDVHHTTKSEGGDVAEAQSTGDTASQVSSMAAAEPSLDATMEYASADSDDDDGPAESSKVELLPTTSVPPAAIIIQATCWFVKLTGLTFGTLYVLRSAEIVWEPAPDGECDADSVKIEDRARRYRIHDIFAMYLRHYRMRNSAVELFVRQYDGKRKQVFVSFPSVRTVRSCYAMLCIFDYAVCLLGLD